MNGTLDELELEPDCFIATCSNSVLPSLSTTVVYSGSAWNEYSRSWQEYEEELVTARERLWAETQHWHRAWQESEAQRAALGADYERLSAETQHWRYIKYQVSHFFQILRRIVRRILPF
jgi:hypothetical protein